MVYKILLHLTENISFWPCILRYIYYMTILISNYVLILFSFVLESSFIHIFISQAAQHCCNDDQQNKWENGDFDPL